MASSERVRLLPVRSQDEQAGRAAHAALAARGHQLLLGGWDPGEPWDSYVARLDAARHGVGLALGQVPSTNLLAWVDGGIVGQGSVRHSLATADLALWGGHIGYAVLPAYRRRGYATAMLHQLLVVARAVGIVEVLVTCADSNVASARVIEHCGGEFESVVAGPRPTRRYWIR